METHTNDKVMHLFSDCVREQTLSILAKVCDKKNLNYVEIVEEFGLTKDDKRDYKPKSKRVIKIPEKTVRCEALSSAGIQCKRSKKDGTCYCRRHKFKQANGTIHTNPIESNLCQEIEVSPEENEVEIEYNGNIVTLENGDEVIHIPSTGICMSYSRQPVILGKLSSDQKYIIPLPQEI